MKKIAIMLVVLCVTTFAQQKGSFTDQRDGKTYKTVKIGSQVWMAENLNYAASGSKCYDNNSANCQIYGRLYNWNATRNACPRGWHLPIDLEWSMLMTAVGGSSVAGIKLKATSGWRKNSNGTGTDDYGFSALPGGLGFSDGDFGLDGVEAQWWIATEDRVPLSYSMGMGYSRADMGGYSNGDGSGLFSVRCVKD